MTVSRLLAKNCEKVSPIRKYKVITREDSFERIYYVEHVLTGQIFQRWETNFHHSDDPLEISIDPELYSMGQILDSDSEILFCECGEEDNPYHSEQFLRVTGHFDLPRETQTDDGGWNITDDLWESFEEFEDHGGVGDDWRRLDCDLVFTAIGLDPIEEDRV
jgi:hypothetical protein